MASVTDHGSALARIAALAKEAAARPDLPDAVKPILAEIVSLASGGAGDTLEPSDVPQTENQSL